MSIKNPDELLRNFRTVNIGKPEILSEDLILNLISFLSYTKTKLSDERHNDWRITGAMTYLIYYAC